MSENVMAKPDYEAECKMLTAMNHDLKLKLSEVEAYYKGLEEEAHRMRAQLDMVYLIFGNRG